MAKLVVLMAMVAVATAGVVVPNRPYAAYPGYGKDFSYGAYPDYKTAQYPARKDYVYAPAKVATKGAYDYPYDKFGYDYKPAYAANDYDYNYRPAVVATAPVKKVVDPYPYYADYRGNAPYAYQPVKKVVEPFPAKSVFPDRKSFAPFASKAVVAPVNRGLDAYPYNYGVQKNVYAAPVKSVFPAAPVKSVFPAKKVVDAYPYSYQPDFAVKKVVDPYPANTAFYPNNKAVNPFSYPAKNVADPYYPSKAAYPVRKVAQPYPYDPYYASAKAVVPAKTVAAPVVKKEVPSKSKSAFGNFQNFANFGTGFGKDLFSNFKF